MKIQCFSIIAPIIIVSWAITRVKKERKKKEGQNLHLANRKIQKYISVGTGSSQLVVHCLLQRK